MMRLGLLFVAALGLLPLGCGRAHRATVSGTVTLNGKPLANATVSFQPVVEGDSPYVAPGSVARTDAEGRYVLHVVGTAEEGAVVGPNRVQISALEGPEPDPKSDSAKPRRELVPARYSTKSELTSDVPSGGTDTADFKLTSP